MRPGSGSSPRCLPVTRFTVLPLVTGLAERRQSLRGGHDRHGVCDRARISRRSAPSICRYWFFSTYAVTCLPVDADGAADRRLCVAGRGALRPQLRAAAAVGLGGFRRRRAGLRAAGRCHRREASDLGHRRRRPRSERWSASRCRRSKNPKTAPAATDGPSALLRDRGFLAIIVASALIQGSHAAYYIFASIAWQQSGFGGLTIAGLWALGVLAEIVVFALSPRFTLPPAVLVVISRLECGGALGDHRAGAPGRRCCAVVQLGHGLTFGLTQVGTMGLMVRHVPGHVMARGQGYLAACSGIVASIAYDCVRCDLRALRAGRLLRDGRDGAVRGGW